jgi:outer membrane protein assembly factor BamD (BamD/ComL family)
MSKMLSRQTLQLVLLIATATVLGGCSAFPKSGMTSTDSASGSEVRRVSYEEPMDEEDDDDGLALDDFSPNNIGETVKDLAGQGTDRNLARKLYGEGEQLYGDAVDARARDPQAKLESTFLDAAKKFQAAAKRWPDSALEEDALFRAGESYFFAVRYPKANDAFEQLLKKYPNTKYLDFVGARRFQIAKYWLDWYQAKPTKFYQFNLADSSRPTSDPFGHAVRVFDRMRLDDPTGKLADDATIAAANAYLATGDYQRADQFYTDLRKTFPSSEHQFMAHYLGVKAKLSAYKGPDYAGDTLDEAETLVKQIRRQFPSESREHAEDLERSYRLIRFKKAEREWNMANYYMRRREYGGARFYFNRILEDFADTPFAEEAREKVSGIAGRPAIPPQRFEWLVKLFPDSDADQPIIATAPSSTSRR